MRILPDSRRAAAVLLIITVALGACTLEFTIHLNSWVQHFVVYWLYNGLVLAAGVVCMARGLAGARERAAWVLIGAAVVSWGVGNTIWTFAYVALPSPPYPSLADVFWLAVYPPIYIALLLLLRSRAGAVRRSVWLDGVIASLAVAAVGTAVVFQAVLDATSGSKAAIATNLAYPLADLTTIAFVVWVLAISGWRIGRAWGLIAAGLLVFSVSDCLYLFQTAAGSYVAGGATDLGWVGGCVLLAWAAWQPAGRPIRARLEGWAVLVAPVGCGLLALAVLVYDHFRPVNPLSLVLSTAAILAVLVRLAMTFAENMQMLAGSRDEARTDALTGLGNRRKLLDDLAAVLEEKTTHVLAVFDLNGFKHYNDSFGHPAGDALLARLGEKLGRFVAGRGSAYRMGGDEFCILCTEDADAEAVVEGAACALADHGAGFAVTAAHGLRARAVRSLDRHRSSAAVGSAHVRQQAKRAEVGRRAVQPGSHARTVRVPSGPRTPSGRRRTTRGGSGSRTRNCPQPRSRACGSPRHCTTWARWRSLRRSSRSPGLSPSTRGSSWTGTPSSERGSCTRRPICRNSPTWCARATSASTGRGTRTALRETRSRSRHASSSSATPSTP